MNTVSVDLFKRFWILDLEKLNDCINFTYFIPIFPNYSEYNIHKTTFRKDITINVDILALLTLCNIYATERDRYGYY